MLSSGVDVYGRNDQGISVSFAYCLCMVLLFWCNQGMVILREIALRGRRLRLKVFAKMRVCVCSDC